MIILVKAVVILASIASIISIFARYALMRRFCMKGGVWTVKIYMGWSRCLMLLKVFVRRFVEMGFYWKIVSMNVMMGIIFLMMGVVLTVSRRMDGYVMWNTMEIIWKKIVRIKGL